MAKRSTAHFKKKIEVKGTKREPKRGEEVGEKMLKIVLMFFFLHKFIFF